MHEESPRGPVTLSSLTGILSFWDSTLQDLLLFTVLASVFLPLRCFGPQRGFLLCYGSAMKPLAIRGVKLEKAKGRPYKGPLGRKRLWFWGYPPARRCQVRPSPRKASKAGSGDVDGDEEAGSDAEGSECRSTINMVPWSKPFSPREAKSCLPPTPQRSASPGPRRARKCLERNRQRMPQARR